MMLSVLGATAAKPAVFDLGSMCFHPPEKMDVSCMALGEEQQPRNKSVAVIGAGISGLVAAYKLKCKGLNVTVFEADDRAGGKIRSISQNGLTWEEGANTMTESEETVRMLIEDLGLQPLQQTPVLQNKRYIVKGGKPQLVPSNPMAFISSNFLSLQSKLQVLLEPFKWRYVSQHDLQEVSEAYKNESVGDFFQRHFGEEIVDYLIDPVVAGTSAADPKSLSLRHAFPEIWHLERRFGSIICGLVWSMFSNVKKRITKGKSILGKHTHGSFSFHGGMQTLTNRLCEALGSENLCLSSPVLSLSYNTSSEWMSPGHAWSFSCSGEHADEVYQDHLFDAVIMTAPVHNLKEMSIRKTGCPIDLKFLQEVNYLPLSVIITSFKREDVEHPLQGFGVLVPSKEQKNGLNILGTLFSSMMFPDRAPSDQHLYTTFVGGSRNRDLAQAPLQKLLPVVTSDLNKLIGVKGQPVFVKHIFWDKAFPLYDHDYDLVLQSIDKLEKDLPGFFYAGNHTDGLSVGKAINSGCRAADFAVSFLNSR